MIRNFNAFIIYFLAAISVDTNKDLIQVNIQVNDMQITCILVASLYKVCYNL